MPGLLRGVARTAVVAGTATTVSNRVSRRQANRWAEEDQSSPAYMAAQPAQPAAAPAPAAPADPAAELEKFAELRDKGVITPEDFDAKKKQLLGI